MSCDTTTCYPCQPSPCLDGCLHEHSTDCIIYYGDPLANIQVVTGDTLTTILEKLNDFNFSETAFIPVTTNTIVSTPGGINGHQPIYDVKIDPADNAIISSANGIKVPLSTILQGKVKVNASDTLDYLEDQMSQGSDLNGIITVSPTSLGGKIYLVPSLNKNNLLNWIKDELCDLVSGCVPGTSSTTSTSSTSTTSTSSTSTTSTSSTTTIAPNSFIITNIGGQGIFDVSLRDEVSLINYLFNNTTNNNQAFNTTYVGTTNESEIIIQKAGNIPIGINVKVDGIVVYNSTLYIGSVTIQNISSRKDIEVILYPYAGTTSSTSTTTSTSTSTSSTTVQCVTYSITNSTGSSKSLSYTNCSDTHIVGAIANGTTLEICAQLGSVSVGLGVSVTQTFGICNTTSTTTSPVCKTYTILNPNSFSGPSITYNYYDCVGAYIAGTLDPTESIEVCAYEGSIVSPGGTVTLVGTGCLTTTSTTSTTTSTTTTSTSTTTASGSTFLVYFGAKSGSTPPIAGQILAGSSMFVNAFNDFPIDWTPFNGVPQCCWFAIPDALGGTSIKNYWYENVLNNGAIGSPSDLFDTYTIVNVSGTNYKVWITNYDTQFTGLCTVKNAP